MPQPFHLSEPFTTSVLDSSQKGSDACAASYCANFFPMFMDLGNPLFPVTNAMPLRRATKAPVGTFTHHTMPL